MSYPVAAPVPEEQRRPLAILELVSMAMVLAIVLGLIVVGDWRLVASALLAGGGVSVAVGFAALTADHTHRG